MLRFVVTMSRSAKGKEKKVKNSDLFFGYNYGGETQEVREAIILYVDIPDEGVTKLKMDETTTFAAQALGISIDRNMQQIGQSGWYKIYDSQGFNIDSVLCNPPGGAQIWTHSKVFKETKKREKPVYVGRKQKKARAG